MRAAGRKIRRRISPWTSRPPFIGGSQVAHSAAYATVPCPIACRFAMHRVNLARSFARPSDGSKIAINNAIIATTTNNSISVNPRSVVFVATLPPLSSPVATLGPSTGTISNKLHLIPLTNADRMSQIARATLKSAAISKNLVALALRPEKRLRQDPHAHAANGEIQTIIDKHTVEIPSGKFIFHRPLHQKVLRNRPKIHFSCTHRPPSHAPLLPPPPCLASPKTTTINRLHLPLTHLAPQSLALLSPKPCISHLLRNTHFLYPDW